MIPVMDISITLNHWCLAVTPHEDKAQSEEMALVKRT